LNFISIFRILCTQKCYSCFISWSHTIVFTTSRNHYSLMLISLHITHYMFRPTCRPSSGVANTKLREME
jgi:hypothetical protein